MGTLPEIAVQEIFVSCLTFSERAESLKRNYLHANQMPLFALNSGTILAEIF